MTGPHGTAFSGRVGWGAAPAVLVVDLVRAYTEPGGPFLLPDPAPAVAATGGAGGRGAGRRPPGRLDGRAVHRGLADGGLFVRKVPALAAFAEDADGGWGELALPRPPRASRWSPSSTRRAFFGTSLAATLHTAGVDTLVVAGVSTSGCIRATATDALNHGFRPQVVRQACADRTPELHEQQPAPTSTPSTPTSSTSTRRSATSRSRTLVQRCDPHHDRGMDPLPRGHAPFAHDRHRPRRPAASPATPTSPTSLVAMLRAAVDAHPDGEALVEVGGERLTYRQLWDRAARVAGGLAAGGVARGDRVAILLPAGVDWVLAFFGTCSPGAVAVPVNTRFAAPEVEYVLADSGADAVLRPGDPLPDGPPARRRRPRAAASWPRSSTPAGPPASPRAR